ncbi:MAG TPA: AraC family transcriptional regulator [Planctomycetota bacterium]|nr:AraC family transcriptional regulator [Planctomycetota bacterium]
MQARLERVSPGVTASFLCRRRREPRFGFAWHFHPEFELTYIVRSRGKRFVGDSITDYEAGDLVLLGSNLPHTWSSEATQAGPHDAVFCQFSETFLGKEFFQAPELLPIRRLLDRSSQGLRFTGKTQKEVGRRLEAMDALEGSFRLFELLEILGILSRSREGRSLSSREFVPSLRGSDPGRIDRVCRFLTEHYTESLPLAQAARVAHLSIPAFSRFFKQRTGKTLVGYLTELRVGRACRALIETDRTVSEIAFESGFNNLSNFNRRFLKAKGMSPREFRREHQPVP